MCRAASCGYGLKPGSVMAQVSWLDRLGRQVAVESYRADGIPVPEDRADELAA